MHCSGRRLLPGILPFPSRRRSLDRAALAALPQRRYLHSERISMREHKYRVGRAVEFFPDRGVGHTAKGRYKIVRLFLGEGNSPQYRIKNDVDGHERMVGERELGSRLFGASEHRKETPHPHSELMVARPFRTISGWSGASGLAMVRERHL